MSTEIRLSKSNESVAVVGAGVIGKLAAWKLIQKGHRVELFDERSPENTNSCSDVSAAMLAPVTEASVAEPLVASVGLSAFELWQEVFATFAKVPTHHFNGGLIFSYENNGEELEYFADKVRAKLKLETSIISGAELDSKFAGISDYHNEALSILDEGFIDNWELSNAFLDMFASSGVECFFGKKAEQISPGSIQVLGEKRTYDVVYDCRGIGAQRDMTSLRGVRGEAILLEVPGLGLETTARFLHPRFTIYMVPRGKDHYYVGATCLESEDDGPIYVQSVMDLLNGAIEFHPAFRFARVKRHLVGLRPAQLSNHPAVEISDGLVKLNGFYRHGFLMGPAVVNAAIKAKETGVVDDAMSEIITFQKTEQV